jgi:hypothetical protein
MRARRRAAFCYLNVMKLRYAAALALVGWYLILAPPESFKDHRYHGEPLGMWIRKQTFDTELECKHKLSKGCRKVGYGGFHPTLGFEGPLCYALCVASDDPRLREKQPVPVLPTSFPLVRPSPAN